ncbi:predicted protein [Plenodomus lingam JN3]|uniref:Predicted protein n=1 Tax=Leptosphaeria maculans (strain JN3 / isolate v23.1.3 / race Av1-4-5-6-7-8) TaxID=985895 RepID=E4ZU49_LEPMJ|nr:predicted protein [Plenodomus lingam JN3]CBX94759.1 predicted protein [Plenodomus lingam JN3]
MAVDKQRDGDGNGTQMSNVASLRIQQMLSRFGNISSLGWHPIKVSALGNLLVSWNELSVGYGSGDRGIYKTSPQILWQKTMVRLGDITVVVVG